MLSRISDILAITRLVSSIFSLMPTTLWDINSLVSWVASIFSRISLQLSVRLAEQLSISSTQTAMSEVFCRMTPMPPVMLATILAWLVLFWATSSMALAISSLALSVEAAVPRRLSADPWASRLTLEMSETIIFSFRAMELTELFIAAISSRPAISRTSPVRSPSAT